MNSAEISANPPLILTPLQMRLGNATILETMFHSVKRYLGEERK